MNEFIVPADVLELKSLHLSTDYAEENPDYVDIISGILDNRKIFIVDENNKITDRFSVIDWEQYLPKPIDK